MTVEADAAKVANSAEATVKDAEKSLRALIERLERVVQDALDIAKSRSKVYVDGAGEQFETAQKYVTERVQERPLAATATALGIGVVIGLLLSGRNQVILRRVLFMVVAVVTAAAAATIALVALSYGLFALVQPHVGSAGAAAIVAAVYAVIFGLIALVAGLSSSSGARRSRRASEREALGVVERLTDLARDRPIAAAGVALVLGVVLMRSPKSLAAVAGSFMDSLTGKPRGRR